MSHDYESTQVALHNLRAQTQGVIDTLSEFVAHEEEWDLNPLFVQVHLRPALMAALHVRDEVNRR